MLEIERVSWKNFLSFGDYVTTLDLSKLGQCLITGEVEDDDNKEGYGEGSVNKLKRSNGAGKTCTVSVIQWILFGRTSHSHNPGDKVINHFIGKDCWGQILFKDGNSITRTRNYNGHNELIFIKNGDETKLNCDTLGTAKIQQQQLAKSFGLDWDIFCGSTFFSQYSKPWMEMADQTRKKALERLLHVDRFDFYAEVAKKKSEKTDLYIQKLAGKKLNLENEVTRLEAEVLRLENAGENFASQQEARRQDLLDAIRDEEKRKEDIKLPDLEKLQKKWDVVKQIAEKIAQQETQARSMRDEADEYGDQANSFDSAISRLEANVRALEGKIKLWQDRGGKVCNSCEQPVPHEHIGSKVEPLLTSVEEERAKIVENKTKQQAFKDKQIEAKNRYKAMIASIAQMQELLATRQPTLSIKEAKGMYVQAARHDNEIARLKKTVDNIANENNPHNQSIGAATERIVKCKADIDNLTHDMARYDLANKHYMYVHKAYHDRNRIKGFVFRDHVPFINSRLRHYLDVFGLDIKLELTDSLSVKTNMWDYEFQSGGERKRTDVAFMLATFDFHEHMFGRQSNFLVMDEVDGRLDDDGIDSLISIIKNDLANRVETLFVISHKNMMFDTFGKEIKVKRTNRLSRLEIT